MSVATPSIAGCTIAPVDRADCEKLVAWLVGEQGSAPNNLGAGFDWALAHSDGGVTWGRFDAEVRRWRLGHDAVPEVSPAIRREALHELRVFGSGGEVMIWRTEDGLRGRLVKDVEPAGARDETDPLRPSEESRILRGDRIGEDVGAGFTRVADATGAEQVLPVTLDEVQLRQREVRLHVRHYFSRDDTTGCVRVAATRLVEVK